jgi:hypothetical protein
MAVFTKEEMVKLNKEGFISHRGSHCSYCGKELFSRDKFIIYWQKHRSFHFHEKCALEFGSHLIIDSGKCKELNREDDRI